LISKKIYTKAILFAMILFTFLPGILTPIIAVNNQNNNLSTNTVYDKVHKGFVYLSETLSGVVDADFHKIYLKEGKEYYFSAKFDNPNGVWLTLIIANGVDIAIDNGDWDANTPKNQWKIELILTPTSTDNFTINVNEFNGFDIIDTNYTLYANRSGFAGYWWMILIGVGALAIIILLIALVIRIAKPKKKGKRRK